MVVVAGGWKGARPKTHWGGGVDSKEEGISEWMAGGDFHSGRGSMGLIGVCQGRGSFSGKIF